MAAKCKPGMHPTAHPTFSVWDNWTSFLHKTSTEINGVEKEGENNYGK